MISKHHNTILVQIPPRTEARLVAKRKDASDWHTRYIASRFHLSRFADEKRNSAFAGSISDTLIQPSSNSPSSTCLKKWKAKKSSPPIMISVFAQLENARQLLGGWCSQDAQGSDDSLRGTLFGGSCYLFFQGTITDGSPPRNAPLRLL